MKDNTAHTSFWTTYKKPLLIGGGIISLTALGISIYQYQKKQKAHKKKKPSTAPLPQKKKGFQCTSTTYPLNYGTCHPDIGIVQLYLKRMHSANMGTTGHKNDGVDQQFGSKTLASAIKHLNKKSFTKEEVASMKSALKFVKPQTT